MKNIYLIILLLVALSAFAQPKETSISIAIEDFNIYGTLAKPLGIENAPLVILVAGSGPTDRNGNVPGMQNNCLKQLSDSLTVNGFAVYRYDKRGIGESEIKFLDENDLRFDDYVNDLIKIIEHFDNENTFKSISIIGHSEGSLIGILAAQKNNVSSFVSIAGAAKPADVILLEQLEKSVPDSIFQKAKSITSSLKNGERVNDVPTYFNSIYRPSVQPYLINWFAFNPLTEIAKLDIPVLIVQGDEDLQVGSENATELSNSCKKPSLVFVDDMNHIFKSITNGMAENQMSYNNPEMPISKCLVREISDFLKKQ